MKPNSALTVPDQDSGTNVATFMQDFTIEATPGAARRVRNFGEHLPRGTWVYVTSLPGSEFRAIVDTCRKLADEGMEPVPHFAARGIADAAMLDEQLDLVTSEAGVRRVLAVGGSDDKPVGQFADTISMLETGLFEKYDIRSIGLAGHPEDPPGLDPNQVREHEARKVDFSRATSMQMYIVTQFVFEAGPVIDFAERIRLQGTALPIVVGLPGLATIQSLIRYAKACGIGPSAQFVARRAKDLRKLLSVQAPDRLVLEIANYRAANPDCGIAGAHIYPFGGFEKSAAWANAAAAGRIKPKADGFTVYEHA